MGSVKYVSWSISGKMRPVLVIGQQDATISIFKITTQYKSKSEAIRSKYFKINDWQQAGLDRQSYVDTNVVRDLPLAVLDGKSAIGRLTAADEQRLIEFISR